MTCRPVRALRPCAPPRSLPQPCTTAPATIGRCTLPPPEAQTEECSALIHQVAHHRRRRLVNIRGLVSGRGTEFRPESASLRSTHQGPPLIRVALSTNVLHPIPDSGASDTVWSCLSAGG